MKNKIIVAGASGKLGGKIVAALIGQGAEVKALIRSGSNASSLQPFIGKGVDIIEVDYNNRETLAAACIGGTCVVSALQGLEDVIIKAQSNLLNAALSARVPRFIPSDYAVDFTEINSENRNFDLRRAFHKILDASSINYTSIYNGAFADILSYNTPILNLKNNTAGYWGDKADWLLDFTTMDDTATFTAAAALDATTPKKLCIASFQISPAQIKTVASEITGEDFKLASMGSLEDFAAFNKQQRAADPESEKELYPRWQSGQYMYDQFTTHHKTLDNDRYPQLQWTGAQEFLTGLMQKMKRS